MTPVAAEAHFDRDFDGVVRHAGEVERWRARVRREFGVDVVLSTAGRPSSATWSHVTRSQISGSFCMRRVFATVGRSRDLRFGTG